MEGMQNRATVLVVEDDLAVQGLLRAILEQGGYGVRTAGSGGEALRQLQECPAPDWVLLDYRLPDVPGQVVLEEIRKSPALAGTRVATVSGYGDTLDLPAELQPDACLPKPIAMHALLSLLAETTR